jgi:hypothetical protein
MVMMFFHYGLEKEYKKLQSKRERGKVSEEEFKIEVQKLHFMDRKKHYYQLDYEGHWLFFDFDNQSWVEGHFSIETKKKRKKLAFQILSIVLVIAIVLGVLFNNHWLSLPQTHSRYVDIEEVKVTPGYSKTLFEGATVTVPPGLDIDQNIFRAHPVSLEEATKLTEQHGIVGPVLYSFEFDAGLDESESFDQSIMIQIDADQTNIPKEAYEDLAFYRIGENRVEQLKYQVSKDRFEIYTFKNSVIVGVGLRAVLFLASTYLVHQKSTEKYGNSEYVAYRIPIHKYAGYNILFPKNHPYQKPKDPSKIQELTQRIEDLEKRFGLAWSNETNSFVLGQNARSLGQAYLQMIKTPEYKALQKDLKNAHFLLTYVYPEKVSLLIDKIIKSHDYLFDERKFKPISYTVDVVMRDPWPKEFGGIAGLTVDQVTTSPYILINLEGLETKTQVEDKLQEYIKKGIDQVKLNRMRSENLAFMQGEHNQLLGTFVHELFHIVQYEYNNKESHHFGESTALLLEDEASQYFAKRGYFHGSYVLTNHDYYERLETEWGEDSDYQMFGDTSIPINHGYTFYHALKLARDKSSGFFSNKNNFLNELMTKYIHYSPRYSFALLAYPEVMSDFSTNQFEKIIHRLNEVKFKKNHNVIQPKTNSFKIMNKTYEPYSIKGYRVHQNHASSDSFRLISPIVPTTAGFDWAKLHMVDVKNFEKKSPVTIPHNPEVFVLPNTDAYVLISQEFTTGFSPTLQPYSYQFEFNTTTKPKKPNVNFDKKTKEFIITLPPEAIKGSDSYQGRLLTIQSSNPRIDTFRKLIEPNQAIVRIPIEKVIYHKDESTSLFEAAFAKMMLISMRTFFQRMMKMPNQNFSVTQNGNTFRMTKTSSDEDDEGENEYVRKSISISFDATKSTFEMNMLTDKNYYLNTTFQMSKIIEYLRYSRPLLKINNQALEKELTKYESDFDFRIAEVFAANKVRELESIQRCFDLLGKSSKVIQGVESDPVIVQGEKPQISETIVPGNYSGAMFVDFATNIGHKVSNRIHVVVSHGNLIRITFGEETFYGRAVPIEGIGQYSFYKRNKRNGEYVYDLVEGARIMNYLDGTLIFNFLPAVLKR